MMSLRPRSISRLLGALALTLLVVGCDALISPQHRLQRARTDLDTGKWGRAAIELRKLVQADPQNAEAWLLLARWSLDVGQARDAQAELDRAAKAGAKGRELDQLRVRMWLESGQPKLVLDADARHAIGLPEPDRSIALAHAYNQLRQYDHALAVLQPLLAAHVNSADAWLAAATGLLRLGKPDSAQRAIDAAMADRSSFAAPMLKAELAERQGRYATAEDAFALAIQRMPSSTAIPQRAEALAGLTEARLNQNKIEQASQSDELLQKLAPSWPRAQLLGARVKLAHGDYLNGIADLERIVRRAPNLGEARMLLATAQVQRGETEQAQTNLEELVRQSPGDIPARKLLADIRLKLNEPEAALNALAPALGAKLMDPQLYALLNAIENKVGNPNSVLQALEKGLDVHPENVTLRLNLAEAYLSANRPHEALQTLEAGPRDQTENPRRDALLIAATSAVQGPAAASAEVNQLLAAHPHDTQVENVAASFFLAQGQPDRARTLLVQALDAKPHDVTSLVNLARLDSQTGDAKGAESALRTALDQDSSNHQVRIALAELLLRNKAFTQAEQLLGAARDPGAPDFQFALAQVALARGDPKQANAALDRAVGQPASAELENRAGLLLLAARQYDSALARFNKATALVGDNAGLWFNVARAQLELNQPAAARESLDKAVSLQPSWVAPVSALALLDLKAQHYSTALDRVKTFSAKHPDDAEALVLQGDVEQATGQFNEAITSYTQAQGRRPEPAVAEKLYQARSRAKVPQPEEPLRQWVAAHPNDNTMRLVLANYYLGQRQLQQAAQQFQAVLEQVPTDLVALNNLAWVYGELGDPRAESVGERAYKLAPGAANVADTLGWILARKHATDRALALLTQAAQSASSDPQIQYHYAYALAAAGKRAEAREVLSKVLAGKHDFDSRREAERLLANLKA